MLQAFSTKPPMAGTLLPMRLLKRLKVIVVIRGRTQGKFGMLLTSPLCLQAEVHISCRRSTRPGNLPRLPSPLCGLPRKANPVDVLRDPRAIRLVARGWRRGLHQHRSPSPLAGRILPWARPLPLIRPSFIPLQSGEIRSRHAPRGMGPESDIYH